MSKNSQMEELLRKALMVTKESLLETKKLVNEMYGVIDKKDEQIKRLQGTIADQQCELTELQEELDRLNQWATDLERDISEKD